MPEGRRVCKDAHMRYDDDQAAVRRFFLEIIRATGWSASKLAKIAGVSHTTITRFVKGEVSWTPSTRTISKVRDAAGQVLPPDQIDQFWLLSQRRPTNVH